MRGGLAENATIPIQILPPDRVLHNNSISKLGNKRASRMASRIKPKLHEGASECKTNEHVVHAHFIPLVGVGKRGEYLLVQGDLRSQHSFGTALS